MDEIGLAHHDRSDRRSFLRGAVVTGTGLLATGVLTACASDGGTSPAAGASTVAGTAAVGPELPSSVPPELALKTLMEGNARYVDERSIHPNRSAERRAELVSGQRPWSAILGCADSRVPPEVIFDVGPGDMFTVRVAGNVAAEVNVESLEYAVGHLGTRLILVLGHSSCGAVHAVLEGEGAGIPEITHLIEPAVEGLEGDEPAAVEANARAQAQAVLDSGAIAEAVASGEVEVRVGIFDLETGAVTLLDEPSGSPAM